MFIPHYTVYICGPLVAVLYFFCKFPTMANTWFSISALEIPTNSVYFNCFMSNLKFIKYFPRFSTKSPKHKVAIGRRLRKIISMLLFVNMESLTHSFSLTQFVVTKYLVISF